MCQAASSDTELPTPGSKQISLLTKMTAFQLELEFHMVEGGQDPQGLGVVTACPDVSYRSYHPVVEIMHRNDSPVFREAAKFEFRKSCLQEGAGIVKCGCPFP